MLLFVVWSEILMGKSPYSFENLFILDLNLAKLQIHIGLLPVIKQLFALGALLFLTVIVFNLSILKNNYLFNLIIKQ
jgi:hypothetical protein